MDGVSGTLINSGNVGLLNLVPLFAIDCILYVETKILKGCLGNHDTFNWFTFLVNTCTYTIYIIHYLLIEGVLKTVRLLLMLFFFRPPKW